MMVVVSFTVQAKAIPAMTKFFQLAAPCSSEMMSRSGHLPISVQEKLILFYGPFAEHSPAEWADRVVRVHHNRKGR